jgi:hypothetical protein
MLVLIATEEHRPHYAPPRDRAVDGELVVPAVLDCGHADCGSCSHDWFGLVSHSGTETAMVVDRLLATRWLLSTNSCPSTLSRWP